MNTIEFSEEWPEPGPKLAKDSYKITCVTLV